MKLLIVFNHPAPYKVKLFNELSKTNEIDVIFERTNAKDRNGKFYYEKNYLFNLIFLKGIPLGKENFYSKKIKSYLKNNAKKYDAIIMNGYSTFAEMKAINFLIKKEIPYILMVNGGVIRNDLCIKKYLKRKYISHAQKYFSPNIESDNYLIHYGANKSNICRYVHSNISQKDIKNVANLPLKYNNSFISVGSFTKRKNNMQLIKLFSNIDETLLLVGGGPLKKKYVNYIKSHNIQNIKILEYMEHQKLLELMQNSKALISLSKEDIFGHTIYEALASGIPVISSDKILSALHIIKNEYNVKVNTSCMPLELSEQADFAV